MLALQALGLFLLDRMTTPLTVFPVMILMGFTSGAFLPMHAYLNSRYYSAAVIGRVTGGQMPMFLPCSTTQRSSRRRSLARISSTPRRSIVWDACESCYCRSYPRLLKASISTNTTAFYRVPPVLPKGQSKESVELKPCKYLDLILYSKEQIQKEN